MTRLWYLLVALKVVVIGDASEDYSINLTILLPIADDRRPFSAAKLRPAVDLAVGQVSTLLRRHMRVSYHDSKCSVLHGINEAFNCFIHGPVPSVYFGPICDFAVAPVARQSYFWNIPVISIGALSINFLQSRQNMYPLLTRAGPVNLMGMTNAILDAIHVYGWRRVKLLYERDAMSEVIPPFCHLVTEVVVYYLTESSWSQHITQRDYYKFDPDPAKINFEEVLTKEVGHEFAGT